MTTEETKQDVAPQDDAAGVTQSSDGIDWETVYKTPQFQSIVAGYKKEAKEAKAAMAARDAAQAEAERAELEKQAKYQQLYETAEKRAAQLKDELDAKTTAMQRREKQLAIQDAARSHEPPFITEAISDVLLLIPVDELPDGDDLSKAAAAQVKDLAKAKPWLLQTTRSDPGSPPGRKVAGAMTITSTGKPMGI
jgi:hypothetical protein